MNVYDFLPIFSWKLVEIEREREREREREGTAAACGLKWPTKGYLSYLDLVQKHFGVCQSRMNENNDLIVLLTGYRPKDTDDQCTYLGMAISWQRITLEC